MIAKAKAITHGANAMRYSVDKEMAELIKVNHLPTDITPSAMWARMSIHRMQFSEKLSRHHPLKNDAIRIEISPENKNTAGWTRDDWLKLVEDFIAAFDGIDLSKRAKRDSAKRTNLRGSQFVASLHHDSKSGIRHLHIVANRIDMNGNVNDAHFIADRAMMAASIVTQRRGWTLAEERHAENRIKISDDCMDVLREMKQFSFETYQRMLEAKGYRMEMYYRTDGLIRGYAICKGHSSFKASELGTRRNLMASKLHGTWKKLHQTDVQKTKPEDKTKGKHDVKSGTQQTRQKPVQEIPQSNGYTPKTSVLPTSSIVSHSIPVDGKTFNVSLPEKLNDILQNEINDMMLNDTLRTPVMHTALLLFAGYLDAATTISVANGGGGQTSGDWGKRKDEDDIAWLRYCMCQARGMCQPRRRSRHR